MKGETQRFLRERKRPPADCRRLKRELFFVDDGVKRSVGLAVYENLLDVFKTDLLNKGFQCLSA